MKEEIMYLEDVDLVQFVYELLIKSNAMGILNTCIISDSTILLLLALVFQIHLIKSKART